MPNRDELSRAYNWDKDRGPNSIHNHALEVAKRALVASGVPTEVANEMPNHRLISPEGWLAIDGLVYTAYTRHIDTAVGLGRVPGTVTNNRREQHSVGLEQAA